MLTVYDRLDGNAFRNTSVEGLEKLAFQKVWNMLEPIEPMVVPIVVHPEKLARRTRKAKQSS